MRDPLPWKPELFCHLVTFQHSGRRLWDLWQFIAGDVMVGDRGIGVYFFILIILYDCDIYVGESKPTYSSVTRLSIINILHCHFPSYYTLPLFGDLFFRVRSYVPRVLCSPGPMFPRTYVPRVRCSPILCSPVPMFPGTCEPLSYVPRYLCSPVLCSPVPMFPVPMFPGTYVPPYLCSPVSPLTIMPSTYVPQS